MRHPLPRRPLAALLALLALQAGSAAAAESCRTPLPAQELQTTPLRLHRSASAPTRYRDLLALEAADRGAPLCRHGHLAAVAWIRCDDGFQASLRFTPAREGFAPTWTYGPAATPARTLQGPMWAMVCAPGSTPQRSPFAEVLNLPAAQGWYVLLRTGTLTPRVEGTDLPLTPGAAPPPLPSAGSEWSVR